MGHSDLSEISRIQRIKTDQYLITDFNPDCYREDYIHTSMNDKDIDLRNHSDVSEYKSVFNPLYLRLSAFYSSINQVNLFF